MKLTAVALAALLVIGCQAQTLLASTVIDLSAEKSLTNLRSDLCDGQVKIHIEPLVNPFLQFTKEPWAITCDSLASMAAEVPSTLSASDGDFLVKEFGETYFVSSIRLDGSPTMNVVSGKLLVRIKASTEATIARLSPRYEVSLSRDNGSSPTLEFNLDKVTIDGIGRELEQLRSTTNQDLSLVRVSSFNAAKLLKIYCDLLNNFKDVVASAEFVEVYQGSEE